VDKTTANAVEQVGNAIRLMWADGHVSVFHYMWLRDNCACPACGDHTSGSRFQQLLAIPDDISPLICELGSSVLRICWTDRHESHYTTSWLRNNCYSDSERSNRKLIEILWDGTLSEIPSVDYALMQTNDAELRKFFECVFSYGFVVVKEMGLMYDEVERLTKAIGYVRDTHFGRVTDLKLRRTGAHLSDFATEIMPHSDETYRQVPTGINIFHCLQASSDGGGISTLVDAHNCATLLRGQDREAFSLLCSLPIQHERRTDGEIIRSNQPAFTLDYEGNVIEVRLNERTMSALSIPSDLIEPAYAALRKAFRIAYQPSNRIEYRLDAGEALVFDNLRVLHGRTAFSGDRLLRQSNVMRDEFYARLTYLREKTPTLSSESVAIAQHCVNR
jgi:alpha-ketoglutarate-dependent taurine dioxygenase